MEEKLTTQDRTHLDCIDRRPALSLCEQRLRVRPDLAVARCRLRFFIVEIFLSKIVSHDKAVLNAARVRSRSLCSWAKLALVGSEHRTELATMWFQSCWSGIRDA